MLECIPMTAPLASPLDTLNRLSDSKTSISIDHLRQTHAQLIRGGLAVDSYVAGALVKLYASSTHLSRLDAVVRVFDQVPRPHVFLWNALIRASLDCGAPDLAVSSYQAMLVQGSVPNKYTYPPLLNACAAVPGAAEGEGRQLHAHVWKLGYGRDSHTRSAGIKMYAASGRLDDARRMLLQLEGVGKDGARAGEADAVCWNVMVDAYMRCGDVEAARELFDAAPRRDVGTWNALVSGYARNGMVEAAREAFERMPRRDEVSWTAMVDAYVQSGRPGDALAVFRRMLQQSPKDEGKKQVPKRLLPSVLAACADAAALEQGKWVHDFVKRERVPLDPVLGTALVDMYAKCGHIEMAWEVFDEIPREKVVSTWNALIGGLAAHGHADEAMGYFSRMLDVGVRPNKLTFVNILTACAHAGLVEEGRAYFASMERDHGVSPETEHYGCMVDLLGRAGLLEEAESMIRTMPVEPNAAVWGTLLNACRIHRDAALAEKVGAVLLELEPRNSGRYALLSNVFAKAGRLDDASKVRKLMKDRGVRTVAGRSLVELDGVVHEFVSGDAKHQRREEIYSTLEEITSRIASEGHVSTGEVLLDVNEEEDKETALRYHSEKLALAFAFISTEPRSVIKIVKNLRVCEDCHSTMKVFSRIYGREVIMRDRVRYHRFRNGECSCKDYW